MTYYQSALFLYFMILAIASSSMVQLQPLEYRWWCFGFLPTHVAQGIERVMLKLPACLDERLVLYYRRIRKVLEFADI